MANRRALSSAATPLFGALLGVLITACSGSQPAEPVAATGEPAAAASSAAPASAAAPTADGSKEAKKDKAITEAPYGTVGGKEVKLYTLTNKNGLVLKVTNYGGIVTELHTPDKAGKMADIVLGYDKVDDYVKATPYFGAVIGRVANRIKNAQFSLEGKTIKLNANNDKNIL
ncbi:MAG: hypothetical protein ABUL60_30405, partial [Myxococcales bacterium]